MSTSILETPYIKPTRPYSQNELKYKREKLYRDLRLSKTYARHACCNHFYLVRKNGRKEKEIIEKNSNDVGNCSVCWKLNKTPKYLKDNAYDLVNEYMNIFYKERDYLTYADVDLEKVFYKWLYENN